MWICQPSSGSGEHAKPAVGFRSESRLDGSPVGTQTLEQLEADVYPAMRLLEQQPRQHRILAKKRPRPLRLVEAFDEAVESGFSRFAFQRALEARDIHLQHHGRSHHVEHHVGEIGKEKSWERSWFKRRVREPLDKRRRARY